MKTKNTLSMLEDKIGYTFNDQDILVRALTHSSYANELTQRGTPTKSNERLEFLGDSVLEILSSTYLFENFTDIDEGELTRLRSEIICTSALSAYAKEIDLGEYLFLGNGEKKHGGKNKLTTLENAFEALLGAIYIDSGCTLEPVKKFTQPFLTKRVDTALSDTADYKSELQQIIQQTPGEELKYEVTSRIGPDNAPVFTVEARLNSNIIGKGTGQSKRKAEQNAAKDALEKFFKNKK